jgi:glycosyltransferase involved in cell wall biosynthesis
MDVTVILPVHNERDNLVPLLDELERALAPNAKGFEVIAIDDASTDGSGDLLHGLAQRKRYLKILTFRQNYGQSAAFDAGFRHASGRLVATMDADGQNDPADLPCIIDLIDRKGYDFVVGFRKDRQDGLFLRKIPSRLANFIIRKVTRTRLRDLGCSLKLYRREFTDELRLYGEMHRFISVLVEGLGARTVEVPVHHRPRASGQSKYGLTRTFKVLLDLLTVWFMRGYQTKPIYVFGGTGMALGFAGALLSVAVLWDKFFRGVYVHRNPLFIVSMMFSIMAVQFLVLGLLAEIMVRTYFESQHKPPYLISARIGFDSSTSPPPAAPAPPQRPHVTHLLSADRAALVDTAIGKPR